MNELIATIHFIGICLFTTAASPDRTLHVVLPRIEGPQSQALGGVEPHTAFLAFKKDKLLGVVGWKPKDLSPQPDGFSYIALNGEILTVHTNVATNPTGHKPANLPSSKCCDSQTLLPAFQTSDGSGAAAIVRAAEGTFRTCRAKRPGFQTARVDTKWTLNNGGALVVWGQTAQGARALVLKGDATLYVGNLPSLWVTNPTYQPAGGVAHYHAYHAMFEHTNTASCPVKEPAEASECMDRCGPGDGIRFGDVLAAGAKQLWCPEPVQSLATARKSQGLPPSASMSVSSECSNSSWP